jgi:HEAT repeat protein
MWKNRFPRNHAARLRRLSYPLRCAKNRAIVAVLAAVALAGCPTMTDKTAREVAATDRAGQLLSPDWNWDATVDAAEYLSLNRTTDPREIAALIKALGVTGRGTFILRERAARALGLTGDLSTVPELVKRLEEDPDEDVRRAAAHALGALKAKAAVPVLLAHALNRQEPNLVAAEAMEALGDIGDFSVIGALEVFRQEQVDSLSETAALNVALAKLRKLREAGPGRAP